MLRILNIALLLAVMMTFISSSHAEENIQSLLNNGKKAIENGKYQEAVKCLGEILTASGDQTNNPKITAFGATVQAYGLLNMNNPQMRPMAKQYLETAINKDPEWGFPKQLLRETSKKYKYSKTPENEARETIAKKLKDLVKPS